MLCFHNTCFIYLPQPTFRAVLSKEHLRLNQKYVVLFVRDLNKRCTTRHMSVHEQKRHCPPRNFGYFSGRGFVFFIFLPVFGLSKSCKQYLNRNLNFLRNCTIDRTQRNHLNGHSHYQPYPRQCYRYHNKKFYSIPFYSVLFRSTKLNTASSSASTCISLG